MENNEMVMENDAQVIENEETGRSPAETVGIIVGGAAVLALLGFGLYKLGKATVEKFNELKAKEEAKTKADNSKVTPIKK